MDTGFSINKSFEQIQQQALIFFFETQQEMLLAVTNSFSKSAVIYKWKDNQFEKFQEIGTEEAQASAAFVTKSETFIVFANYYNSQQGRAVNWGPCWALSPHCSKELKPSNVFHRVKIKLHERFLNENNFLVHFFSSSATCK